MYETTTIPYFNYSYTFGFEEKFIFRETHEWMIQNWHTSFYYALIYVVIANYSSKRLSFSLPRYELRPLLVLWNLGFAIFSIVGTCRMLPEFVFVLREFGFEHSFCDESFVRHSRVSGFWTWAFVLSKIIEFGDTAFLILRKRPLTFLHWFHHSTALMCAWYGYANALGFGRWVVFMNYVAHSLMYSYYSVRALGITVSNFVPMLITTAQMTQMTVGVYIASRVYSALQNNRPCTANYFSICLSGTIYTLNWILFARFFYNAYFRKSLNERNSRCKVE